MVQPSREASGRRQEKEPAGDQQEGDEGAEDVNTIVVTPHRSHHHLLPSSTFAFYVNQEHSVNKEYRIARLGHRLPGINFNSNSR